MAEAPAEYQPSEDEKNLIAEVNKKFDQWRQDRRIHEAQWFINAAFLRGNQYVEWDAYRQTLTTTPAPSHRQRLKINRVLPKFRARLAKFLKTRPQPVVIPASTDREDRLNARATQKVLDYLWRKLRLETKYRDALVWSGTAGKGFWWFYWDGQKTARVQQQTEFGPQTTEAMLGDVAIEVGTPFEMLVADQSCSRLEEQPAIMRARRRAVDEVQTRYPKLKKFIKADSTAQELFHYERQIGQLNSKGSGGAGFSDSAKNEDEKSQSTHVVVKELFERPCGAYPKGRYTVVAGDILLRTEEALPYEFDAEHPYPVVEFADVQLAGQFWPTTLVEQLIFLQREYNLIRSKIAEQLRLMAFPKLLAAKQHQIPPGAWTSEPGEFVEYIALPNIPPPMPWHPPNIAGDAWKTLELIKSEFEDLTHIYASVEGQVGGSQSGFQTNLLQEAADSVHAPDIRGHEIAIEQAALKMRTLMKLGYTVPRLITIAGRNLEPEVIEFSADSIDENADIVVQAGSAMPMLKAQKIQSVLELWKAGVLGPADDPEVRRRALGLLEMGEFEAMMEQERTDEDQARLENAEILKGNPIAPPQFYENHDIHYQGHTLQLKSAEMRHQPDQVKLALVAHVIQHMEFINPMGAFQLAQQYGLDGLIPPPPPPPMLGPGGPPPGGPAPPPPGPHQGPGGGPPPPNSQIPQAAAAPPPPSQLTGIN